MNNVQSITSTSKNESEIEPSQYVRTTGDSSVITTAAPQAEVLDEHSLTNQRMISPASQDKMSCTSYEIRQSGKRGSFKKNNEEVSNEFKLSALNFDPRLSTPSTSDDTKLSIGNASPDNDKIEVSNDLQELVFDNNHDTSTPSHVLFNDKILSPFKQYKFSLSKQSDTPINKAKKVKRKSGRVMGF